MNEQLVNENPQNKSTEWRRRAKPSEGVRNTESPQYTLMNSLKGNLDSNVLFYCIGLQIFYITYLLSFLFISQ